MRTIENGGASFILKYRTQTPELPDSCSCARVDGCVRMPIVYKLVPESMDPEGQGPADSGLFTD